MWSSALSSLYFLYLSLFNCIVFSQSSHFIGFKWVAASISLVAGICTHADWLLSSPGSYRQIDVSGCDWSWWGSGSSGERLLTTLRLPPRRLAMQGLDWSSRSCDVIHVYSSVWLSLPSESCHSICSLHFGGPLRIIRLCRLICLFHLVICVMCISRIDVTGSVTTHNSHLCVSLVTLITFIILGSWQLGDVLSEWTATHFIINYHWSHCFQTKWNFVSTGL